MSDPHDEEYHAEVAKYVLWCEGRLKELAQAGLVEGQSPLTEKGWDKYRAIVESGFVPDRAKVILTLQSNKQVPRKSVEQLATLLLNM